jgi:DNA-binding PadR family transcriptional regulator
LHCGTVRTLEIDKAGGKIAVENLTVAEDVSGEEDAASSRDWMRGSSPLKGAILSLVIERPGHGYDLGSRLSARLGPAWAIDPKRLYRMLDQLESAGLLLATVETDPENPRQHRTVYCATPRAPRALTQWMETLAPREPTRAEIQAKVAAAREEDAPRLIVALREYERDCLRLLALNAAAGTAVRSWLGLVMGLVREAGDMQLRAELEWARHARQRIGEHVGRDA